jgi:hypothetical protein
MEAIVLMGIVVTLYCGFHAFRELKSYLVRNADTIYMTVRVMTATAKTTVRKVIKLVFKPCYRLSKTYFIQRQWFISQNHRRYTKQP